MTSRRTLVVCAFLGLVVVVAAGIQGVASFSGPRWNIDWSSNRRETLEPQPSIELPTRPPQPLPSEGGGNDLVWTILLWVAAAAVIVFVALFLWRWLAGRPLRSVFGLRGAGALTAPEPEATPAVEAEPDVPVLRSGVEEALRLLDSEGDPHDAVLKAWLGLQQTAEDSGILRRAAETPTEFTSRIMSHVSTDDRAIRTLLSLYLRTRFGDHPVTAADVARAREALEGLARTWNSEVSS